MVGAFAEITLSNPKRPDLNPLRVRALADTGALMLCIPQDVASQLHLETEGSRKVAVADGRQQTVPYVGPIEVGFEGGICFVGALVMGTQVLLGTIPMDSLAAEARA